MEMALILFSRELQKTLKPFHGKNSCFHVSPEDHVSHNVVLVYHYWQKDAGQLQKCSD